MYAWYAAKDPLRDDLDAHLTHSTSVQVYKYGTAVTSTNNAIDGMGGIGVHRKDNQNIFLTQYWSGTSRSLGTQSSGRVEQHGSQVMAQSGKFVNEILRYYYNGSSKVGGAGKIFEYFLY
jgi:hypothetical protein